MTIETRARQRDYFLRELADLREDGAAFAARFPRVAGALDVSAEGTADPHVERLVEAFAFLTGRIQRNLDGQLPRIASGLLDALYPQLTAPTPAMAIAEIAVDPRRARAAAGFVLPRGAQLTAGTDMGAPVRLRTGWDVELWPVAIAAVDRPDPAHLALPATRASGCAALRIRLTALGGERFADLAPRKLRLRLSAPLALSTALLETLVERTREIWAMDPGDPPGDLADRATGPARLLPAARVTAVGFAADEALLPDPPATHAARRLAQEWFAFPEKFLFVDIEGLDAAAGLAQGRWLDLALLVDAPPEALAAAEGGALRLHSVPAINLFSRISEPIRIDRALIEHLVAPDARLERSTEIHSIERVTLTRVEPGLGGRVAPFFGAHAEGATDALGWIARRAPTRRADLGGSDVFIGFRDGAFAPVRPAAEVAFAHLTCTNRGLAELLPAGLPLGLEVDAPVAGVRLASRPTPQRDPPAAGADLWRLVAHLTANQLSLTDGPQALAALRAHLAIHAGDGRAAARQIDGIAAIQTRRVAGRIGGDAWRGFVRGTEATVTLREDAFIGGSGYLLGAVLARILALYAPPSGFVELVLRSDKRPEEWARWPRMAGDAALP